MTVTSNKKRPADFANDDEPELKRLHRDGTMSKVRLVSLLHENNMTTDSTYLHHSW